jgi:hypothetical protein
MGDRLYGDAQRDGQHDSQRDPQLRAEIDATKRPDCQLTAYQLRFICPINQTLRDFELSESQLDLLNETFARPLSVK